MMIIQSITTSNFGSFPICPTSRHQSQSCKKTPLNLVSSQKGQELTSLNQKGDRTCDCFDLHKELVPYEDAWIWQKMIVREKIGLIERNDECPDTLIVLQHQPVYTMGTGSSIEYLNFDIKNPPFDIYRTERGGEVTYHGPGQLTMYPIINLRNHKMDLHWYLRELEEVVIRVLSSTFSIKASRIEGLTGVWVGDQKLAAIGIKVSQWITYHGLALNVTADLEPFNLIVPCGIRNRKVGSIKGLLGEACLLSGHTDAKAHHFDYSQLIDITSQSLIREFSEVFQLKIQQRSVPNLEFLVKKTRKLLTGKGINVNPACDIQTKKKVHR